MELKSFYHTVFGIQDKDIIENLSKSSVFRTYQKEELIVSQGEVQTSLPLVIEGVLRGYYIDESGKEITDCFGYKPGDVAMASFELLEPASLSIIAATEKKCVVLSMDALIWLIKEHTEILKIYIKLLAESLRKHYEMKNVLYLMDVTQRYHWFLDNYPGLIDIVKHKDIASFLGTTPVHFSRIRAENKES